MIYKKYPKPIIYTEEITHSEVLEIASFLENGDTETLWNEVYTLPKIK